MHYSSHAAIAQKIHALAGRAEPQARDVFDLNVLLSRPDATNLRVGDSARRLLPKAIENAMTISFDEYRSKVVAYLDPDQSELYADQSTWDEIQHAVVDRLEALG